MSNSDKKKKTMTFDEVQAQEIGPIWNIIDFSSNIPISMYADTTVIKTSESIFRSSMISHNTRLTGEDYLLNAKKSTIDISLPIGTFSYSNFAPRGALSFRNFLEEQVIEEGRAIKLPPYTNVNAPIGPTIKARRSLRSFGTKPMSLKEVSTVLYYGDGVSGTFDHNPTGAFEVTESLGKEYISHVRTAPSGGGLYPVTLYFIALNVDGLDKGLYKYMPIHHSVELMKKYDDKDLETYFSFTNLGREVELKNVGICIYYVYSIYENSRKYNDMALQFALIEAGEISENIHLICTAENLSSCDMGGYEKARTEQFFNLDGLTNHIIHLTLVGRK